MVKTIEISASLEPKCQWSWDLVCSIVSSVLTVNTLLIGVVAVHVFFQGSNKKTMLGHVTSVLTVNTLLIGVVIVPGI